VSNYWPIYIPSKNRSGNCATANLLKQEAIPFTLVVEPQEADLYKPLGNLLVLPDNNRGLCFSRQTILNHARKHEQEWFWMLDDDVSGVCISDGKKNHKASFSEVITKAQSLFALTPNLGQGALEYAQYSWSSKKNLSKNGYCDVFVCINTKRTRLCNYSPEVELKEDRDFTLQVLSNGRDTARASKFGFVSPKNGSNKGGLFSTYSKKGLEAERSAKMQSKWGKT
jgi:hypothetical protein